MNWMNRSKVWLLAVVLGVGGSWVALAFEKDDDKKEEANEVVLKFSDCPEAVRKTLTREARGAKIETVDLEAEDGTVLFEADVVIDGKNYEILVAANGTLVAKKLDEEDEADEVEVKLADCPEAVRKTLTREADGAKIDKVDKFSKEGRWLFETDVKIDGKNYEIIVTEQGLLLSKRVDEEDEEDEKEEKKGDEKGDQK